MDKVYNKAFKVGFCFNILIFLILNIISFVVSRNEHIRIWNKGIRFSGSNSDGPFLWGFPFKMFLGSELFRAEDLVINTFIIVGFGFILGFLFRFVWSKLSEGKSDLE
jgi:hypothetical protein